jgi:hypothetical protein
MTRRDLQRKIDRNEQLAVKWEEFARTCDESEPADRATARYSRGLARTFRERKAETEAALNAADG